MFMRFPLESITLEQCRRVHIIGISGTLMGAFAVYLKNLGITVTGSDQNCYPPMSDVLSRAGILVYHGYQAENLLHQPLPPDLVLMGNVVREQNPEAQLVMQKGWAYASLPEILERFFLNKTHNLVVAGTHGKTTTSSLLAHTLITGSYDPSFFIGGVAHNLPSSFHLADSSYFVLEGDEYDTAFWDKVPKFYHYLPDTVLLTSIEYDHADIYPDLSAVRQAFVGLLRRMRSPGRCIFCIQDPEMQAFLKSDFPVRSDLSILTYGLQEEAQFYPSNVRFEKDFTYFDIFEHGKKVDEITMRLYGMHSVMNALAVWIAARELGVESHAIQTSFKTFLGVKRRQEIRGEKRGILLMDDFAHHPTAVRETLRALRMKFPHRRLVALFEPRSATSRRRVFQKQYVDAFLEADCVWIAQPFASEQLLPEQQFSSAELVADLKQSGKAAALLLPEESVFQELLSSLQSGDLVVLLSNGSFWGLLEKLWTQL